MVINLKGEVWNTHPIYNWFAASNLGRIKHIKSNGREVLNKLFPINGGYLQFHICKGRKIIDSPLVHRFVYECFHQCIIPDDLEINHRNCKRDSNFIENLELLGHQANIDYSVSKQVGQYTLDGSLVKVWKSAQEAGRNGYVYQAISQCCNNKYLREGNNIYRGYYWKFIDE